MGTRSRIVIRRYSVPNIHLWMQWDGYFAGQGDRICKEIVLLLSKYSNISMQNVVEELQVEDLPENTCQNFSGEMLADFIEGKTDYKNDLCDDIEYEYIIDFGKGILLANWNGKSFVISTRFITDGFLVSELEDLQQND